MENYFKHIEFHSFCILWWPCIIVWNTVCSVLLPGFQHSFCSVWWRMLNCCHINLYDGWETRCAFLDQKARQKENVCCSIASLRNLRRTRWFPKTHRSKGWLFCSEKKGWPGYNLITDMHRVQKKNFWNVFNRITALCLASFFLPPWAGTLALYVLCGPRPTVLNSSWNEVLKMALYEPSQEFLLSLSLEPEMTLIPTDRPTTRLLYLWGSAVFRYLPWCLSSVLGPGSGTD